MSAAPTLAEVASYIAGGAPWGSLFPADDIETPTANELVAGLGHLDIGGDSRSYNIIGSGILSSVVDGLVSVIGTAPANPGGGGPGTTLIENTRNRTLVVLQNTSGSTRTVSIFAQQAKTRPADPGVFSFPAQDTLTIVRAIPAGAIDAFWAFPAAYNDSNGKVKISYDDTGGMLVGATVIDVV